MLFILINLPSQTGRLSRMLKRFDLLHITNYKVIEAVGLLNPTLEYLEFIKDFKESAEQKHRLNVLGCFFSHILAFRYFFNSGESECVILEDDAVINYELVSRLNKIINEQKPGNVNSILLSPYITNGLGSRVSQNLYKNNGSVFSAAGYWLNRAFAEETLKDYDKNLKDIKNREYLTSEYPLIYNDSCVICYPPLIMEECIDTNLQSEVWLKAKLRYWTSIWEANGREKFS